MTRLESRPTGEAMGSYCFSIDVEGHVADARVAETLMGLRRVCAQVRYLGSYARADGRRHDAAGRHQRRGVRRRPALAGGSARLSDGSQNPGSDLLGEAYLCCDGPSRLGQGPVT